MIRNQFWVGGTFSKTNLIILSNEKEGMLDPKEKVQELEPIVSQKCWVYAPLHPLHTALGFVAFFLEMFCHMFLIHTHKKPYK